MLLRFAWWVALWCAPVLIGCGPVMSVIEPQDGLSVRVDSIRELSPAPDLIPPDVDQHAQNGPVLDRVGSWGDDRGVHAYGARWSISLPHAAGGGTATGANDGRVVFFDSAGQARAGLPVGGNPSDALLLPTGHLAIVTKAHELISIDSKTGALRWRTKLPEKRCLGLAVVDGGRFFANVPGQRCGEDGLVGWRAATETGELVAPDIYDVDPEPHTEEPGLRAVLFDPQVQWAVRLRVEGWNRAQNGCIVHAVPVATRLELFDAMEGTLLRTLEPAPEWDAALGFDAEGALISVDRHHGYRWTVETGELVGSTRNLPLADEPDTVGVTAKVSVSSRSIRRLTAAREGDVAAWADSDGTVWLSDGTSTRALTALPDRRPWVSALAFDASGRILVATHNLPVDATIERWDVVRRARTGTVRLGSPESRRVFLRGIDEALFVPTWDHRAHVAVDLRTLEDRSLPLSDGPRHLRVAAITSDGETIFANRYGTLRAWDFSSGESRYELGLAQGDVWLSPDDRFLLFIREGARLWDVAHRREVCVLDSQDVLDVDFESERSLVAIATRDGSVRIFRLPDCEPLTTLDFEARFDTPTAIAFSRQHLWTATARGVVFRHSL